MNILLRSLVRLGRELCLEGVLRFRVKGKVSLYTSLGTNHLGNRERTGHGTCWLEGARNWPNFKCVPCEITEISDLNCVFMNLAQDRHPILTSHGFDRNNLLTQVTNH